VYVIIITMVIKYYDYCYTGIYLPVEFGIFRIRHYGGSIPISNDLIFANFRVFRGKIYMRQKIQKLK
ncbi:MAG: hypothetical protein KBT06_05975, partial [Prevotellaceae bacterium]|nr:hypothetical protein [Candidatus Colivivens equi]